MQTFLPYADFEETAKVLDVKRLGKQRVEGVMILKTLSGLDDRFLHNPAVKMWRGAEFMLAQYTLTMCRQWQYQGYEDNMEEEILDLLHGAMRKNIWTPEHNNGKPWWLGAEGFHLSHRSNLVRKDPQYYRQFWPDITDQLPYVWPAERPTVPR